MHNTVKDPVGDGGVSEEVMPISNGYMAGYNRRRALIAVIKHFLAIADLLSDERIAPVISDQDVDICPCFHGLG